jgi:hypothetical protein
MGGGVEWADRFSLTPGGQAMYDSASRQSIVWPVIVAVGQGATWAALIVFVMLMEPLYERVFSNFKQPLPYLTQTFIMLGHFLFDYWYLLTVPLLLWTLVNGFVVWQLESRRSTVGKLLWYGLTCFAPYAFLTLANLAFMIPMMLLLKSLSGRG